VRYRNVRYQRYICWTFPISSFAASMHLLDCIVAIIDRWPFRCNEGHARIRDSQILAGTQIGHVTLWHSPNDCNTLRHCSQPLHAWTHNISCPSSILRVSIYRTMRSDQWWAFGERFPCVILEDARMSRKFFICMIARILQSRKCKRQPHQYM